MVVIPHLLQYTLESSFFRLSLGIAAHSFAAGGVKVGRDSTVILFGEIVDSGNLHFTARAHDEPDDSTPGMHITPEASCRQVRRM